MGTLVGVLPGLGPTASISLLIPISYYMSPVSAIIMLSGLYYGTMYGGSTTSILVNIPGEVSSIITVLDGYQMARKGRAGAALGISAFGSFIAGTISVVLLMFLAPPLSEFALKFGPAEFFSLMILGLILLGFLSSGPICKALMMVSFGLFLGSVGLDKIQGTSRFTFGTVTLLDGIGLVPIAMGIFGIGEILCNMESDVKQEIYTTRITNLLPTLRDWFDSIGAIIRGSVIGFFLGILPGGGSVLATFASYSIEKRVSKTPEKFGTGMIAGVAGPESANNAAAGGAFIPLLTLGIPANPVMAILFGALMIHGIEPGPMVIVQHPNVFWGLVTSMYLGNIMLLLLNLPLIGIWVKILRIPYGVLFPMILLVCALGAFTIKNDGYDVFIMAIFGVVGYVMRKYKYDPAPLVLAFVLGPIMEQAFRRSLLLSDGSPLIFVQRPISLVLIICACFLLVLSAIPGFGKRKRKIENIVSKDDT